LNRKSGLEELEEEEEEGRVDGVARRIFGLMRI
jgi:hypothetical protein